MIESQLKKAKLLLDEAGYCANHKEYNRFKRVKKILKNFVENRHPYALWLKASMPNLGEKQRFTHKEFEKYWLSLIKESAYGGCAGAQYQYGCQLYDRKQFTKALRFYEKGAQQGYAPAQWCYGLDTLYGVGVAQDEKKGLYYIRLAAEQRYDYAIEFFIRNHQEGNFGLEKNADAVQKWETILKQTDMLMSVHGNTLLM